MQGPGCLGLCLLGLLSACLGERRLRVCPIPPRPPGGGVPSPVQISPLRISLVHLSLWFLVGLSLCPSSLVAPFLYLGEDCWSWRQNSGLA